MTITRPSRILALSFTLLTIVSTVWLGCRTFEQKSLDARLLDAAERGDAGAVQELLERGADANAARFYEGIPVSTALTAAARGGNAQAVAAVLLAGANPNAWDCGDNLAGHITAAKWAGEHTDTKKLLKHAGARE